MTARSLRQHIARAGLLDAQAARLLGITKAHLHDLVSGDKPIHAELANAVKALAGKAVA